MWYEAFLWTIGIEILLLVWGIWLYRRTKSAKSDDAGARCSHGLLKLGPVRCEKCRELDQLYFDRKRVPDHDLACQCWVCAEAVEQYREEKPVACCICGRGSAGNVLIGRLHNDRLTYRCSDIPECYTRREAEVLYPVDGRHLTLNGVRSEKCCACDKHYMEQYPTGWWCLTCSSNAVGCGR